MNEISVTVLTKNSEKHLQEVLKALVEFDEVVIYDNGSSDKTLEIARSFANVSLHQGPFLGFGPTHNAASALAKHDWIFSVDSDEVVTADLLKELHALSLDYCSVYSVARMNYYRGKWIKGCGWSPDCVFRLYNRKKTRFSDDAVHEKVISDGMNQCVLKGALKHYSYMDIDDFLRKMQHYSSLFAEQNRGKMKSSPCKAVLHAFFAFFKSYFLKKGFVDGYEGFLISRYNAHTAFYKYCKLYEVNREEEVFNVTQTNEICTDDAPKA